MRPLTDPLPKALLEVAGEPFLAHQLRLFARQGIANVKLLVGYRWEQVRAFAQQYDPQPFHLDPEFAKTTHFEGLVASGIRPPSP